MVHLPENRAYSERNILNESIFAHSTLMQNFRIESLSIQVVFSALAAMLLYKLQCPSVAQ